MSSLRLLAAGVVIVLLLLLYAALVQHPELKTREEAVRFVLADLASDNSLPPVEKAFSVFSVNYLESAKEWTTVVKVTLNPHAQCPSVMIRTYQLLPIRHGLDKTVTENCATGAPIAFEEEAIIASRQALSPDFTARAYTCGYRVPITEKAALEYCPDADLTTLQAFAAQTNGVAWIAEWRTPEKTELVALDEIKTVLATKTYNAMPNTPK